MQNIILTAFMPHGYCMQWQPGLVGTHVVADAAIALAYFSIPSLLFTFIKKRPDVKFNWIFVAFGLFIMACGITHVMEIVTLWVPAYRWSAFFKVITALVSVVTAVALFRLMPSIVQIPTPEQHRSLKETELALLQTQNELKKALGRFQGIFENAAIGLSHIGSDGTYLLVNRELCRMLGYEPAELLGSNAHDLIHPDDQDSLLLDQLKKGQIKSYTCEKRYIHKRSMSIWVELTVSLVRDIGGQPDYFVVAAKDISQQKRAAAVLEQTLDQLRQRERQVALLFEEGGVGDFTWNVARDVVSAHPMVWELYGHPGERGPQPAAWFEAKQHPGDLPAIRAHLEKVLETPSLKMDIEFRIIQPDSSIRWVACRGSVVRDQDGKPLEVYGLNIDISHTKEAQEEVRASEQRLVALTDAMPQLVWFTDAAGNMEFFNRQWYEYTGQEKGSALNWGWQPAVHSADVEKLLTRWRHALATGCDHEAEFRIRAKDGSYRWFLGRGRPLRDAAGKIIRWFGTCTDIEERKASETRLLSFGQEMERRVAERTHDLQVANDELTSARVRVIEAHNQLELRVTELAETNEELGRKNQEVESFVYIVSHDLRSPLVNLQGFSKELELSCDELRENLAPVLSKMADKARIESILCQDIPGSLRYIVASTSKFERLIDALLELSRHGRHVYRSEELNMGALVQTTLDSMRSSIDSSGAQVTVGEIPNAYGDATALGQVLANLIGNALKYLQPGRPGQIEVGGQAEDSVPHFWVRDNGAGIPESAKPRLFQVFQRFHPSLAAGEGMGLAVVKKIVERHGGTIWAEGEEGVGTTFHFTLSGK
jgi:PAS domain S-box-containing protein